MEAHLRIGRDSHIGFGVNLSPQTTRITLFFPIFKSVKQWELGAAVAMVQWGSSDRTCPWGILLWNRLFRSILRSNQATEKVWDHFYQPIRYCVFSGFIHNCIFSSSTKTFPVFQEVGHILGGINQCSFIDAVLPNTI